MLEMEYAPTLKWARVYCSNVFKWSSLSSDPVEKEKQMKDVSWFVDLMQAPSFKGLCKMVVCTAGCDALRDEGQAYAKKLVEVGCKVTLKSFEGVPHPFMYMDAALPQARIYIKMLAKEIKHALT
ncbi:AB hydrolase superfamily [Hyphodiscus hymeniophilus]|uniref:AB hydrolase superfamily n=1 Tax=Hyphodiscus hymeniophilus TaxID=353542 RepID=A0A9P6SLF7_9HELO|nr:AB hydrolase superfamily [Hyphodiscus hymeniophilus]